MSVISRSFLNVIAKEQLLCFRQPLFSPISRRISLIVSTSADLAPPNSTRHCSTLVNFKMSQKSITSFFTKKSPLSTSSTSDGDASKNSPSPVKKVKTPIKNKEQDDLIKEEKSQAQNSPLRETNQDEATLDSPIKKVKTTARKRIASSSDEENGSPKKRLPRETKTCCKETEKQS